ncbi:hypothetical protein CfE428DRAFT_2846 [Chthoniobacter flavus Ellin428]|uniref:Uncharacterized protein n=1 Tax=Chthoniobacter flavus Ellin428 TaxID=497964 RepID=B4D1Q8_9BACT|nr:hypothetical protein [Chthoniobacter flavus]EDY19670.1 hypothetical protein CfE428DRAFT_2846 [Chthoniobacter flavus Ellin428]TCO92906.1 hypothetical protein EV701_105183 [Chthoniobacter flavus]
MPYDLKKALASVSKSPQSFAIYEGSKGVTVLIGTKDAKEAEATAGTGCRLLTKGKCAKNEDNAVAFKTNLPPQKKWTDGLKKAFAAAGCSSTHFVIEEEGEESAEEQSQQASGSSTPPPTGWKPGAKPPLPTGPKPTPPPRGGGVKEGSESESEEVPTGRPRSGGGTPPTPPPGWKSGVKPPTAPPPSTPPPTPPPRGGGEREASESEGEQTGWKPGVKPPLPKGPKPTPPPTTPPPTPPRGGGGNEASESESEDVPTGRNRSDAVSRGSTAPTPPRPGATGGTPPTPPPRTGTPKPGGTASTPPRPQGPPDPVKLEKEAREHLALRKGMPAVLTGVLQNYTGESAKLDDFLAKATQHAEEARTMDKSNLQQLDTAIGLVRRYLGEAESVVEEVEQDWSGKTAQGSEMMQARSDNSTLPSTWTPEQKGAYVRESGAAFGAFDKIQRQIQKAMADMHTKVQEIKLIVEEAESYSGTGQDPEVFVKRLVELNKDASDAAGYFSLKLTKLDGSLARQKAWAEGPRLDEATGKTVKQLHGLEVQAQEKVNSTAQRFEVAARRAEKVPTTIRSNAGVAAGLKQFNETAVKLKKDIAAVKSKQELSLNYLSQAIAKLG